ncbi:MAG: prepilin peptidase [Alphaproteobacteria bacterium]|nr:prepilin peptidase [Alphaproteobacteria bacterium]
MSAALLVMVVLPVILALAAGCDLTSYTIPNLLQLALVASFIVFALASGMSPVVVGLHVAAGIVGLIAGFTLFALGLVGGGDAKLFASVVLWLGLADLASYALMASIMGGMLTLALLGLRTLPLPGQLMRFGWLVRLHDKKSGIPYGVALAAGALLLLPQTEIFRLAAGS